MRRSESVVCANQIKPTDRMKFDIRGFGRTLSLTGTSHHFNPEGSSVTSSGRVGLDVTLV